MAIPYVKIQYMNGQLGIVGESSDGLLALVVGATAVGSTFLLNTAYSVTSMDDLAELGITEGNNTILHRRVSEFYDEAESGTELVIYGVATTTTMTDLCDYEKTGAGYIRDLITKKNGALRAVIVGNVNTANASVITEGLNPDVFTALPKAQQLADWATVEMYAPLFIVLEGYGFTTKSELKDLSDCIYNRCAVVIGDTTSDSAGACIGTIAGRLASSAVQRNIGRVKSGSLSPTEMYLGDKAVDDANSLISLIYDKCYITPRKYVGKNGYYFTDDCLACVQTDDYSHITARRVIDKAYRIAYDVMLDILLDDLDVNEDGTLQTVVIKSWQQTVENAINKQMTANGELSADDGNGCKCYIDETQNVLSTSKLIVTLKVRPSGYARYVDVNIGFQMQNE